MEYLSLLLQEGPHDSDVKGDLQSSGTQNVDTPDPVDPLLNGGETTGEIKWHPEVDTLTTSESERVWLTVPKPDREREQTNSPPVYTCEGKTRSIVKSNK